MNKSRRTLWALAVAIGLLPALEPASAGERSAKTRPTAAAERAKTVSPGSADTDETRVLACPQFNWSGVERAEAYELNVFEVDEAGRVLQKALEEHLPAGSTGWSPSLDRCLETGHFYAWTVRALVAEGPTAWSEPRFFRVAESTTDLDRAVERALARLLERRDTVESRTAGRPAGRTPQQRTKTSTGSAGRRIAQDSGSEASTSGFGVDGAGNVHATSFSGDGAGLTSLDWDQLMNVPAGFADGVDDNSDVLASLACANGEIPKLAGGVWACGEDLDSLGGLSCNPDEVAQFNGSVWECLPLTVDNLGSVIPGQPTNLRLRSDFRFPGKRRLEWNMDTLAGVAGFIVYQANFLIDGRNKERTSRQVAFSLFAPVDLFLGSGEQHFRVQAINHLGEAGPLSPELTLDTTSRLAYIADQDTDEVFELYVAPASEGEAIKVSDLLRSGADVDDLAWSPDGSRLAYRVGGSLYVVSASGDGATRVNDPLLSGTTMAQFSWSADGSRLAYVADQDTDEVFELYVVSASGGGTIKLNDPLVADGDVEDFAWSPDGGRLAYRADQETDEVLELYVVSASGGGANKVNDPLVGGGDVDGEFDLSSEHPDFAWSPDGTRLAYLADQDTDESFNLYVVPASGGGATKIYNPRESDLSEQVHDFAWSPDGSRLAFQLRDFVGDELHVAATSGTSGTSPLVNGNVVGSNFEIDSFAWSPDGKGLAYIVFGGGLHVTPASGSGITGLSGSTTNTFAWSPDGGRLAYRDQDGDLYVVSASGGPAVQVNRAMTTSIVHPHFAWSPGGDRLAFLADQDTDDVFELYVVSASGSGTIKVNDSLASGGDVSSDWAWSPLGAAN